MKLKWTEALCDSTHNQESQLASKHMLLCMDLHTCFKASCDFQSPNNQSFVIIND